MLPSLMTRLCEPQHDAVSGSMLSHAAAWDPRYKHGNIWAEKTVSSIKTEEFGPKSWNRVKYKPGRAAGRRGPQGLDFTHFYICSDSYNYFGPMGIFTDI